MAGINLSDLPPKYQQQAMKQVAERMQKKQAAAEQPARSKYGNVKTGRDALRFDSKKNNLALLHYLSTGCKGGSAFFCKVIALFFADVIDANFIGRKDAGTEDSAEDRGCHIAGTNKTKTIHGISLLSGLDWASLYPDKL